MKFDRLAEKVLAEDENVLEEGKKDISALAEIVELKAFKSKAIQDLQEVRFKLRSEYKSEKEMRYEKFIDANERALTNVSTVKEIQELLALKKNSKFEHLRPVGILAYIIKENTRKEISNLFGTFSDFNEVEKSVRSIEPDALREEN